jgi:RNA polymerase sigma-70 factor (ECF subfamily)
VTDEELVALAQRGDTAAFDQLVLRHQAAVYRATLAALRSPADAEEAAQDAFVRAWTSLGRFRADASFRTWLLTIAWNRALSRRRSVAAWWRRRASIDDAGELRSSGVDTQARSEQHELVARTAVAINALSPKLRDALLLAQSGDYGYDDIARMLAVAVGTVKWRVSEARRQVKHTLDATEGQAHVTARRRWS